MFLASKALVTSFLAISFYVILLSSPLSAKRKKFSFFQSQIKIQPFLFTHVKNESIRRTGSCEKSSSKILLLVAVALYARYRAIFSYYSPCIELIVRRKIIYINLQDRLGPVQIRHCVLNRYNYILLVFFRVFVVNGLQNWVISLSAKFS